MKAPNKIYLPNYSDWETYAKYKHETNVPYYSHESMLAFANWCLGGRQWEFDKEGNPFIVNESLEQWEKEK